MNPDIEEKIANLAKSNEQLDQERIDRQTAEAVSRQAETMSILGHSRVRQGKAAHWVPPSVSRRIAHLRRYAEMRPQLNDIRESARRAYAADPEGSEEAFGMPLSHYLKLVDELDLLCAFCEADLAREFPTS